MAKKSFKGLDSLLKKTTPPAAESSKEVQKTNEESTLPQKKEKPNNTSKLGTKSGETRATFIVNEDLLETIKALALWDRVNIKEIMHNALEGYVNQEDQTKIKKALTLYRKKNK